MGIKRDKGYTTIQIRKDINEYVRKLCEQQRWTASTITERYWLGLISASLTGSIQENI
jgi:hypothetical protein